MRSISLVQKLEFDYKGSVYQNAVCFTDVDNDGLNELCVCNTSGDLYVYKGTRSSKPWKVNLGMGNVIVLCGGAVQDGQNVLCSLDAEGKCHLFDVFCNRTDKDGNKNTVVFKSASRAVSPSREGELRLLHHERLQPNAKCAILQDIDNDDSAELIVGYTDRYVRIFKWQPKEEVEEELLIPAKASFRTSTARDHQIKHSAKDISASSSHRDIVVKQNSKDSPHRDIVVKQNSKDEYESQKAKLSLTLSKDIKFTMSSLGSHSAVSDISDGLNNHRTAPPSHPVGSFVMIKQFSLFAQLGSIAICKTVEGLNQLLASQPNGGYSILGVYDERKGFSDTIETPTSVDSPILTASESFHSFYPIHSRTVRSNCHINTEIVGNIQRAHGPSGVLGICTQEGNFMTLESTSEASSNPVKNISEHSWFAMSKLDVNNNGDDEIVLCSMNGMTYIVDKKRDIVSFNFNDNVAAFQAGCYGGDELTSSPCLCYVTLSGRIYLYYNVWIQNMKVKCVHGALIDKINERPECHYILDMFRLPNGDIDHQKFQIFVKKLWSE